MVNKFLPSSLVLLLSVACNTPPPKAWLRFEQDGPTNWTVRDAGLYESRAHGADLRLDLHRTQTRIEVVVENASGKPVEIRLGPEAAVARVAIGEVLLRSLDGAAGIGDPRLPYTAMQAVVVENGWRGTFDLDLPLGRETELGSYGQYMVLTVEVRNGDGVCERRTLPLVATNAGTMPRTGR